MHLKPHYGYENKTVFFYFLTISGVIHLIFIFSTSGLSHFLRPAFNLSDYASNKNNYVIEIDLKSDRQEEERLVNDEMLNEEEKDKEAEEELPEEQRQLFVDTPENAVDEDPRADTNKIGEKGSIAKDMYSGEDSTNDKPRLESNADLPGKVPEELASAVSQESGLPAEAVYREPVEENGKEAAQAPDTEEAVDTLSEVSNSGDRPEDNEVERLDKVQEEAIVQDDKIEGVEDRGFQSMESVDTGRKVDIEAIEPVTPESEVAASDSEQLEQTEFEVDEEGREAEKKAERVEEYTKTASIPKAMMKEIVEGRKESVVNKAQNNFKAPAPQTNYIPEGDDTPFFEDNISNAPIKGAESFNIKKHEYAPYYKHIKDKIRLYWLLQYGTDASINQITNDYKPIVVTFKALSTGRITDVIIKDSAGNELLASKIQISIQNTILDKFPEYIKEKFINVKFSYYFF